MRRIHVIAAVIRDAQNRILIAKRPDHAHQGGLWEFPGGKVEEGETRRDGLGRELLEELGIAVTEARPLLDIRHDYPDKSVRLDVWLVTGFDGEAHGAEGQPVRWVAAAELDEYAFPAANAPIVRAAQLPEQYLITPDVADEAELFSGLERARDAGIKMVQLRQTGLNDATYQALAQQVLEKFGGDFQWMLKGDTSPAWPGAGWHLTSRQLRAMWTRQIQGQPAATIGSVQNEVVAGSPEGAAPSPASRPQGSSKPDSLNPRALLAASCHNAEELKMAADLGVDFVTLSPINSTASHPDAQPLGWERTRELIDSVNIPVYLLGGLSADELPDAFEAGAQGVAGIRQLWG
ncbi:Nudix family hydrolase [Halopseudomonas bauzanensis]|uniref:Nudix family hydrolase n=1 Tax=Halopseudomonas bauzanensis TaxID=653930 RepID=UPI001F41323D|nr:Nudix family hydrolase [Halopseudomonas bauzanensis]